MVWLPPIVLVVNLSVLGLLMVYSSLNLRPYVPGAATAHPETYHRATLVLTVLLPTTASVVYLWPILRWLRRVGITRWVAGAAQVPAAIVDRAANAPIALASISLLSWVLAAALFLAHLQTTLDRITLGLWAHFMARPLLAGLIAAVTVFFAAEYVCRTHAWPILLAATRIEGNPRLWKIHVTHRFLLLWLAISFLPLSTVALTAFLRTDGLATGDPTFGRAMLVIILIAASAGLGGAALAWLLSRSMGRPLVRLQKAMARVRAGDFSVREPVSAPDEIGELTEGFNLMAERLSASYEALETRNRELAEALDRVAFLESVKRGLDRFVPDTVRRAIEENPDAPALGKALEDVTVLFVDIEGYSRLSEELSREALTGLIERYFSLFLGAIRSEGGDINETAGDGLMILFQSEEPGEHAAAAVRTALAIRDMTAAANDDARRMHPPIRVNIGISSGECHVGSTRLQGVAGERWTFTATGPVTNLAARLGDRAINGQILLSPETARRVAGPFRLRSLGLLSLKNLASPVEAWEVEGRAAPGEPGQNRDDVTRAIDR